MIYSITLAVGIILSGVSLYLFKGSVAFIKNSERTTATVIELEEKRDSDGTGYKAIFKFKTGFGQEVIFNNGVYTAPASWDVGEEATIVYDPANPSSARILNYWGAFRWSVVLMAIAMPLIVIGGGYYLTQGFLK